MCQPEGLRMARLPGVPSCRQMQSLLHGGAGAGESARGARAARAAGRDAGGRPAAGGPDLRPHHPGQVAHGSGPAVLHIKGRVPCALRQVPRASMALQHMQGASWRGGERFWAVVTFSLLRWNRASPGLGSWKGVGLRVQGASLVLAGGAMQWRPSSMSGHMRPWRMTC